MLVDVEAGVGESVRYSYRGQIQIHIQKQIQGPEKWQRGDRRPLCNKAGCWRIYTGKLGLKLCLRGLSSCVKFFFRCSVRENIWEDSLFFIKVGIEATPVILSIRFQWKEIFWSETKFFRTNPFQEDRKPMFHPTKFSFHEELEFLF